MKTCFIINYWADTDDKVNMVVDLINQLNSTNYETVYTSLTPINKKLSSVSKFSLYNNDNKLINIFDILDYNDLLIDGMFFYETNAFKIFSTPLNYIDVSYSLIKQLTINLKYLKDFGYTHFHFINGDCLIDKDELSFFRKIEDSVLFFNKKAYFDDLSETPNGHTGFSSIYFYSEIDFFLSKITTPTSINDFFNNYTFDKRFCSFERVLGNKFKESKKVITSLNTLSNKPVSIFKKSNIDIITRQYDDEVKLYIIQNKTNVDEFDLINVIPNNRRFEVFYNKEKIIDIKDGKGFWYINTFPKVDFEISVYDDGSQIFNGLLNNKMINKLCSHTSYYE
jgi:hypothetical protein